MVQVKHGDTVTIHYTGYLKDGSEFESTNGKEPLTFTIGRGEVIPGFEKGVIGMHEGDVKSILIPPEDAYGDSNKNARVSMERSKIPSEIKPEIGMKLQARARNGTIKLVTVTDITDDKITVDVNHPLAGQELTFEVKLLKIL